MNGLMDGVMINTLGAGTMSDISDSAQYLALYLKYNSYIINIGCLKQTQTA